jgi:acetyl esterase/lipase
VTSWIYLGVSVFGLALTLNAYRPLRIEVASIFTFFSGWLTSELPVHAIVWQAAATVIFAVLGAFHHLAGWSGLGLTLASWVGLANLARQGAQAGGVMDAALDAGLGPDWHRYRDHRVSSARARPAEWAQLVFAFWLRDRNVERIRNIDYWGDGIRRHRLDIYRPRRPVAEGPSPVVVYLHGSGWVVGDKREQGLPMMLFLASQGWTCVTANYRLSPRATWPDHLVDAKRAMAWVHRNIASYGGDPDLVVVSGGSAGGQLASLVALTPGDAAFQPGFEGEDTHADACVAFYAVYDLTNRDGLRGNGFLWFLERTVFKAKLSERPELFRDASPMDRITPAAPPFMVIHGSNDSLVPVAEARQFVARLRAGSHEPVVYAELPGAQHAFEVFRSLRTAHAVGAVADFLAWIRGRRVTAGDPPAAML